MYNLPYFKENDADVIMTFIHEHPFAFLTGCDKDNKPVATQIPVFIDERDGKLFLSGHMMRQTDHHLAFLQNNNVLAVFTSPHTYVSASWYENKKQGSTWNYMSVHAKGQLKFLDEQALLNVLKRTTTHFENNPASGANFEDLSKEYVDKMAKAIIAFEIEVQSIENVFKLSQNRDKKSFENIAEKLGAGNEDQQTIAREMMKRKDQLYK
ncbi:MAG: FMN-binding negative transcriptional regulator [Ferruginibacter sp.]